MPDLLWTTPEDGQAGGEAGRFENPGAMVADPDSGHLFVADRANARIVELTAWGEFVKAWGWGVVASGPGNEPAQNERQELTVRAGTGTYRLIYFNTYVGKGNPQQTTVPIGFNWPASDPGTPGVVDSVQEALAELPGLDAESVAVTGGPGDASGSNPYLIEFLGDFFADKDAPPLGLDTRNLPVPVGTELKCSIGILGGDPDTTSTWGWLRNGAPIAGETAQTYTTEAADAGKAVQCQRFATNAKSGVTGVATPAQIVEPVSATATPTPPASIPAPTSSSSLTVGGAGGQTLTCNPNAGGWQGSPAFSYRWFRDAVEIPGATTSTYVVTAGDLASAAVFQCVVNGSNPGGGAAKESENLPTSPGPENPGPPTSTVRMDASGPTAVETLQGGGSFEICVPAAGDVCQSGQPAGAAPGKLPNLTGGIALDGVGDLYVYEMLHETRGEGPNFRVQKFNQAGEFLAMWGGEVNKTKSAEGGSTEAERNLCTKAQVEGGDVCGTGIPVCNALEIANGDQCSGTPGLVKGQFQMDLGAAARIAIGPGGTVFVGDAGRIQEFTAGGSFAGELKVPGELIKLLAMDGAGDFYVAFHGTSTANAKEDVRKLTPAGEGVTEVAAFDAANPKSIAVAGNGDVYIDDHVGSQVGQLPKLIGYSADGSPLITPDDHLAESGNSHGGLATSEACGIPGVDVYLSDSVGFLNAYGPAPEDVGECPPPEVAPVIGKQFSTGVGVDSATVRATINPKFWADTRYYVEYGTAECASGGCTAFKPTPPGSLLTAKITQQQLPTEGVLLAGLEPNTTYHYRFVAKSTGGGPVFGVDPDGPGPEEPDEENGLEGKFKTQPKPGDAADSCPNAGFRTGASARLPDCRAYEMVSPVDKDNGDIIVLERPGSLHAPMSLNQSTPDGGRFTYSSYRAFGDVESAPFSSTYLATRGGDGWESHGISPPRGRNTWEVVDSGDVQYRAFTDDLCTGWLVHETVPPLTEAAPSDFANLYTRDNCGAGEGAYEELIPVAPESIEPANFKPELQGLSADGGHALFRIRDKLTGNAVSCTDPETLSTCKMQLYESLPGGGIRFVCILPGGAPAQGCSAGSASGEIQDDGRSHMVANAISDDGSRIFWSDQPNSIGRIFVRLEGAVTLPVSLEGEQLSGLAGSGSQYWTAAADGTTAIFSTGDLNQAKADLYEYELATEETVKIAGKVNGLLGASDDAKRIYLVSREALNAGAVAGEPNLYLYEAGEGGGFTYIATLAGVDAIPGANVAYSPVSITPKNHTAQVTADGLNVAFMSRASLTGYDNIDANSGEADAEVFLYDAGADELRCVSCNPTGARPAGSNIGEGIGPLWAAAQIPTTQTQLYPVARVFSPDGNRLYFESFEALEPTDINGKKDVYQWQAVGKGHPQASCTEASSSFNEQAGGCVDLISSGASEEDSSLVDISADGEDVFFATAASLLPQDPGLVDIYDARVGGGFPTPPSPPPFCEGEACQSPAPPPPGVVPSSSTYEGPGNPPRKSGRRCPKGKHKVKVKGKTRCVPNKKKSKKGKGKGKGNRARGAAR